MSPKFLFDLPDPLAVGPYRIDAKKWASQTVVRAKHTAALLRLAGHPLPYPGGEGRAVLLGGGGDVWPMSVALCRMLREVGYAGPVQFWHRGSCEPVTPADLAGLNVEIVDADSVAEKVGDQRLPRGQIKPGEWESKSYALAHTNYEQVVWLDSDVVPLKDPTPLFEELAAAPLVYWAEPWHKHLKLDKIGFPLGLPGLPVGLQAGQFAVDRRGAWPVVAIAQWMAQHSDFYYQFMWGDQDALAVAVALTGTPVAVLGPFEHVKKFGGICRYRGEPLFSHYYEAKHAFKWAKTIPGWGRALRHVGPLLDRPPQVD